MQDVFEGAIIVLIGIGAVWGAWQVPASAANETWAGLVPMAIACSLLLLGCAMTCWRVCLKSQVSTVSRGAASKIQIACRCAGSAGIVGAVAGVLPVDSVIRLFAGYRDCRTHRAARFWRA